MATAGERDEFVAWARLHRTRLLRAATLVCGDQHLAEDLVQEALTKVAARWPRLRDGSPEAYARQVIFHDHVSAWRRRRREVLTAVEVDRPTSPQPVERRIAVLDALALLTDKQRAVVVLRYFEDLSERDTAETLAVSVGTVKSQTHAALRRLREAMPELADLLHEEH